MGFSEVTGACGEQFDPELTAEGPWPSRRALCFRNLSMGEIAGFGSKIYISRGTEEEFIVFKKI